MVSHFWIKNPKTRSDGYCVNFNGILSRLNKNYSYITINYDEVLAIITKQTKEDVYSTCKDLFDGKFPQLEEDKKELSKKEQSQLENIFLTHKNL
ncbi:MAG: hypothetical protein AABY32_06930 [Nanoarchaeota archaeon]